MTSKTWLSPAKNCRVIGTTSYIRLFVTSTQHSVYHWKPGWVNFVRSLTVDLKLRVRRDKVSVQRDNVTIWLESEAWKSELSFNINNSIDSAKEDAERNISGLGLRIHSEIVEKYAGDGSWILLDRNPGCCWVWIRSRRVVRNCKENMYTGWGCGMSIVQGWNISSLIIEYQYLYEITTTSDEHWSVGGRVRVFLRFGYGSPAYDRTPVSHDS